MAIADGQGTRNRRTANHAASVLSLRNFSRRREETRGDLLLFAVCIGVALVALVLPDPWSQSLAAGVRRTVLRPIVLMAEKGRANNESRFRLVRLWWRPDRAPRPRTALPVTRIDPHVSWCEDPGDRRYNSPFRRSASEPGDRLWRDFRG